MKNRTHRRCPRSGKLQSPDRNRLYFQRVHPLNDLGGEHSDLTKRKGIRPADQVLSTGFCGVVDAFDDECGHILALNGVDAMGSVGDDRVASVFLDRIEGLISQIAELNAG